MFKYQKKWCYRVLVMFMALAIFLSGPFSTLHVFATTEDHTIETFDEEVMLPDTNIEPNSGDELEEEQSAITASDPDELESALANVEDGGTIIILEDIFFEKNQTQSAIKIESKAITLNLNGKNLSILNLLGYGLELVNDANLDIIGRGDLSIKGKFEALHVNASAFSSEGNINTILESSTNVGLNATYESTVTIQKGSINGVSGGINVIGNNNNITFNGPITVNGQPDSGCHGVNLGENYSGNIVQINGSINVASGKGAGIYVPNGGTVIVGNEDNPASVTSTGNEVIWTRNGDNTAHITVYGEVIGNRRAIYAAGDADIKVFGNVSSTSNQASVFAVEGFANSDDDITITITGNVEGPNGVKYHGNNGMISVIGNVIANGSDSSSVGVSASYGSVSVIGNVSATNGIGAEAGTNGQITIDGVLSANTYIKVNKVIKSPSEMEDVTTKEGYHTYMDGSAVVWIKEGEPVPDKYYFEIDGDFYEDLETAIANVGYNETIKVLKNYTHATPINVAEMGFTIDLNGKNLVIKVTDIDGPALIVNKASLQITGPGEFNVEGEVYGLRASNGAYVTVTNVTALDKDKEYGIGVYAEEGAQVKVLGNINAKTGAHAKDEGTQVKIHGEINQVDDSEEDYKDYYVKVDDYYIPKTWGGFIRTDKGTDMEFIGYTDPYKGEAMVLVKADSAPEPSCAILNYKGRGFDILFPGLDVVMAISVEGSDYEVQLLKDITYTETLVTKGGTWHYYLDGYTLDVITDDIGLGATSNLFIIGQGALNVTGKDIGVQVYQNGTHVDVTNATATSEDGIGILVWNEASVNVFGNVTGSACGIGLNSSDIEILVNGNIYGSDVGVLVEDAYYATVIVEGSLYVDTDRYLQIGDLEIYKSEGNPGHENPEMKEYLLYTHILATDFNLWVRNAVMYDLTVENGSGTGTYAAGGEVPIKANPPAQGKVFDKWVSSDGGSFADVEKSSTVFIMPANDVIITATYKDAPVETYTLRVIGSYAEDTGAGQYPAGAKVSIHAGSRTNYSFAGWTTSGGGSFSNASSASTTFIMPNNDTTITANWTYKGEGSGSTGGGSRNNLPPVENTRTQTKILAEKRPDQPVTVAALVEVTDKVKREANIVISDKLITDAINRAQSYAKAQGKTRNGTSVELSLTIPKEIDSLAVTLTQSAIYKLVKAEVKNFKINSSSVAITLDEKALEEIIKQSEGNVTIKIKSVENITADAKKLIGKRPIFDISISCLMGGKTNVISDLKDGIATISIKYKPNKNEAVGYLYGAYINEKDTPTLISKSGYDTNEGLMIISTNLISTYGVAYKDPSEKFIDIDNHWAKESIDYVVGRGLISGTSETTFAPNMAMTRGMLVAALGRLAGVDAKAYNTNSFTDVKDDSSFRPYIEWAYQKDIVKGIGNQQFAPDREITREEIAVIFVNYTKATGYKLPIIREATTFVDASNIGSYYQTAVMAMQQAGMIMGDTNYKFNPKNSATRGEVSSMLHRYIKLTIDPNTANGWTYNDLGQWLYYKNGKPLTGAQVIDGVKYFFNNDGSLRTGWVMDDENWRYYSGNNESAGWMNISGKRYYFTEDGLMVAGKWIQIDDNWYYFYYDGSLAKNTKIDGYEVDNNGVRMGSKKNN